ncbi:hypothetical protein P8452_22309 [Trifolium repens]|nr:hypothetical protein P8452_22309 [Trifolium repens]
MFEVFHEIRSLDVNKLRKILILHKNMLCRCISTAQLTSSEKYLLCRFHHLRLFLILFWVERKIFAVQMCKHSEQVTSSVSLLLSWSDTEFFR